MADLNEELKLLIRTRHAIVTMRTSEEAYATKLIRQAAREMGLDVLEWTISHGLRRGKEGPVEAVKGAESLPAALAYMRGSDAINIYILKDAIRHLADARAERLLREVAEEFSRGERTVFLIDSAGALPDSLRTLAVPFEVALPDREEILQIVKQTYRQLAALLKVETKMTQEQLDGFVAALRGLTRHEIEQVVAEAALNDSELNASDIDLAVQAKRRRFRDSGVLDFVPPPAEAPAVGGMDRLQEWLKRRAKAFSAKAREFGLTPPKGILMLGVQGCGKSMMARHVAASWRMPLLRMDVGALYDKYIGETEKHLREAFSVAAAMAPCVVWIDEIEKGFASASAGPGGAATDGGLSQRLFGQLLTWMQEHAEPIFLVATANDVAALPPELLRKGRFDEVFFVDLPDAETRGDIFRIHLAKRKRDARRFDLSVLAAASEGFSGAEIEEAVVAALYAAFNEDRDVTTADLLAELARTRPLSVLMAEKVAALRAWASSRCVPAD